MQQRLVTEARWRIVEPVSKHHYMLSGEFQGTFGQLKGRVIICPDKLHPGHSL